MFSECGYSQKRIEETCYGCSSTSDPGSIADRSCADLAVQQRLGLLAQRRCRVDSPDSADSRALKSDLDQLRPGMNKQKSWSLPRGIIAGLVGGLVGSWVMNEFQATLSKAVAGRSKLHGAQSMQEGSPRHGAGSALRERGQDDESDDPAERTANFISAKVFNRELSKDEKNRAGVAVHYAFGATSGALYGMTSEVLPSVSVAAGFPFGAVFWLLADEMLVPALGLSKAAGEYSVAKHAYASIPLVAYIGQWSLWFFATASDHFTHAQ
jgi:putative membrane protein